MFKGFAIVLFMYSCSSAFADLECGTPRSKRVAQDPAIISKIQEIADLNKSLCEPLVDGRNGEICVYFYDDGYASTNFGVPVNCYFPKSFEIRGYLLNQILKITSVDPVPVEG